MHVFRRSGYQLSVEIAYTLLTPVSIMFVITILFRQCPLWLAIAVSLSGGLVMGWLEIGCQAIRLELENDILRYYKRNNLVRTICLADYTIRYRKTIIRNSAQNLWLDFYDPGSGCKEFAIDCMPLGDKSFIKLLNLITSHLQINNKTFK